MQHVWGKGEVYIGIWWVYLRKIYHLEDPGIDGRILLNGSLGSGLGGMDWIDLA
jgi:hypothetical protein